MFTSSMFTMILDVAFFNVMTAMTTIITVVIVMKIIGADSCFSAVLDTLPTFLHSTTPKTWCLHLDGVHELAERRFRSLVTGSVKAWGYFRMAVLLC